MIRDFGPESCNQRERRAYAHAMIEAHRRREIPRRTAEMAILAAVQTTKGKLSGLSAALDRAAGYEAVQGLGACYDGPRWPHPESGSPRVHILFDKLDGRGIRNPVAYAHEAWPVIRDELAARGYGMHDAGFGCIVAVVLDRELAVPDQMDIYREYGWIGQDDPNHHTSLA